jgi:hypothetical protein
MGPAFSPQAYSERFTQGKTSPLGYFCGMQTRTHTQSGPDAASVALQTRREAAAILKVSVETLKRWEKRNYLTAIRCGPKLVRYHLSEIQSIAAGRRPTNTEIAGPSK